MLNVEAVDKEGQIACWWFFFSFKCRDKENDTFFGRCSVNLTDKFYWTLQIKSHFQNPGAKPG